jgi:capsular exopolysaccharide synthesis family protein
LEVEGEGRELFVLPQTSSDLPARSVSAKAGAILKRQTIIRYALCAMPYARFVMSRVYRALEKAEREKQDKLGKKTFLERPRGVEGFQKEEMPLEVTRKRTERLSPAITEEVPILIPSDNPFAAEEFRKLKTQVFHWSPNPPHVILVTSATPNEGKTTVSVNLAMAISLEIHKEAILIDADLRKPSVHLEKFRHSKGLSNYLADQSSLSDILVDFEVDKLRIIPAGPSSKKSAELIGSRRMEELLKTLRTFGEDTYIIIDSPPLLSTSEPVLLSKWVDGVILVVMADRTPKESIKRAIRSIDKQKIIGVVLNQKEVKASSYYSNYYHDYYHR